MADAVLIAGLGNPGKQYDGTRHNIGFEVIDRFASKLDIAVKKKKFNALIGEGMYESKKLIVCKPQAYMNCSGQVLATICGFFQLSPQQVMVITDDMALETGRLRLRPQGSSGGHNGLADIIEKLKCTDFPRLRIGIGNSRYPDTKDYVLGKFSPNEQDLIQPAAEKACQALFCWLKSGIDIAMSTYNAKPTDNPVDDDRL